MPSAKKAGHRKWCPWCSQHVDQQNDAVLEEQARCQKLEAELAVAKQQIAWAVHCFRQLKDRAADLDASAVALRNVTSAGGGEAAVTGRSVVRSVAELLQAFSDAGKDPPPVEKKSAKTTKRALWVIGGPPTISVTEVDPSLAKHTLARLDHPLVAALANPFALLAQEPGSPAAAKDRSESGSPNRVESSFNAAPHAWASSDDSLSPTLQHRGAEDSSEFDNVSEPDQYDSDDEVLDQSLAQSEVIEKLQQAPSVGQDVLVLRTGGVWTPATVSDVDGRGVRVAGTDQGGRYEKRISLASTGRLLRFTRNDSREDSRASLATSVSTAGGLLRGSSCVTKRNGSRAIKHLHNRRPKHGLVSEHDLTDAERKKLRQLEGFIKAGMVYPAMKMLQDGETGFPVNAQLANGRTLLHVAACGGAFAGGEGRKVLRCLAVEHALEARDAAGDTPLLLAVKKNRLPMVEALVAVGADVETKDAAGATPLLIAASSDHFAGRNGSLAFSLLVTPVSVRSKDPNGTSVLHTAINEDHPTLARLLTIGCARNKFADPFMPDEKGRNGISLALKKKDKQAEWAALLLEWGAPKELIKSNLGGPALASALKRVEAFDPLPSGGALTSSLAGKKVSPVSALKKGIRSDSNPLQLVGYSDDYSEEFDGPKTKASTQPPAAEKVEADEAETPTETPTETPAETPVPDSLASSASWSEPTPAAVPTSVVPPATEKQPSLASSRSPSSHQSSHSDSGAQPPVAGARAPAANHQPKPLSTMADSDSYSDDYSEEFDGPKTKASTPPPAVEKVEADEAETPTETPTETPAETPVPDSPASSASSSEPTPAAAPTSVVPPATEKQPSLASSRSPSSHQSSHSDSGAQPPVAAARAPAANHQPKPPGEAENVSQEELEEINALKAANENLHKQLLQLNGQLDDALNQRGERIVQITRIRRPDKENPDIERLQKELEKLRRTHGKLHQKLRQTDVSGRLADLQNVLNEKNRDIEVLKEENRSLDNIARHQAKKLAVVHEVEERISLAQAAHYEEMRTSKDKITRLKAFKDEDDRLIRQQQQQLNGIQAKLRAANHTKVHPKALEDLEKRHEEKLKHVENLRYQVQALTKSNDTDKKRIQQQMKGQSNDLRTLQDEVEHLREQARAQRAF
ncbi:hypothetical protein DIPPA_18576 [Diplonema papillatum]|nr:hypothetical protein DIPPA_18576 [Diplonema papillatum]